MWISIKPVRQRGADRHARALSSSAIDVDRSIDRVPWSASCGGDRDDARGAAGQSDVSLQCEDRRGAAFRRDA